MTIQFSILVRANAQTFQETVNKKHSVKIQQFIRDGLIKMMEKHSKPNFELGFDTVTSVYWYPTPPPVNPDEM